jgi:AraC-like DNA-binding protein
MLVTAIFIYLFISLLLLNFQWMENKSFFYFILIILIYCFRNLTTAYSFENTYLTQNPLLLISSDLLAYLTGPLTFYLFKSLIRGKLIIDYKFLFYCIPLGLFFINVTPIIYSSKSIEIETLFWSQDLQLKMISISNFSFLVISFYLYFKAKKNQLLKPINDYYLKVIVIIFTITSGPRLTLVLSLLNFSNLRKEIEMKLLFNNLELLYFITILTPLSALLFPKFVYGSRWSNLTFQLNQQFHGNYKKETAIVPSTQTVHSSDADRILTYIEDKKTFLQPDFSLHTISRDLNIPMLRVSKCFNKDLNVRFIEYRNKKRVEYSITLFKQNFHKNMSIEGIALKCGFKNRISYYNAFRAIYNQTPMEWIKNNI